MKRSLRSPALVLGACLAALAIIFAGVGALREGGAGAATISPKTKTVCVGRFLIDLPETAKVELRNASVAGFDIRTRRESEPEFVARAASREAELKQKRNKLGQNNIESAQDVNVNGLKGRILIHGRVRTYGIENEQRVYSENVAVDGYLHKDNVSFDLIAPGYDPELTGNTGRLIAQIVPRAEGEVSLGPGFCINGGFIRDPLTADQHESVTMFAGLPGHPDLGIVFSSLAGTNPDDGLIARDSKAMSKFPVFLRVAFNTLRKGKRNINGLPGEEVVFKTHELNLTEGFSFKWEMQGKPDRVYAPLLTLELGTNVNPRAGKPVQSSMSEAELFALWDSAVTSIRVRPASRTKAGLAPGPGRSDS